MILADDLRDELARMIMKMKNLVRRYETLSRRFHPRVDVLEKILALLQKARRDDEPGSLGDAVGLAGANWRKVFPMITTRVGNAPNVWESTLLAMMREEGEDIPPPTGPDKGPLAFLFDGRATSRQRKVWEKFNRLQDYSSAVLLDFKDLMRGVQKLEGKVS